jgi:type IV pilus assembly protein PilY1
MKTALRALPLVLAAILVDRASAQTCYAGQSPRSLVASGFADGVMNVPKGEDTDFLFRSAGKPNIFFLLDSSTSMQRLPPNGPSYYPGTLPPLQDLSGLTATNLQAFNANCSDMTNCPVVGCGLDPVSAAYAGTGTVMGFLTNVTYSPPCGTTLAGHEALMGATYNQTFAGLPVDYAHESSACPHWSSGTPDHQQTGDDGYDPDWYCGSTGDVTRCSGQNQVNFFDEDMVFHDTVVNNPGTSGWIPDGWSYNSVNPAMHGSNPATVTHFCSDLYANSVYQGTQLKQDICSACLTQRGFFFDGRLQRVNQEGRTDNPPMAVPSIWYLGNFLNMYPPKFIIARKVLKDTIMYLKDVRSGIAHFSATGAEHSDFQPLQPTCDHPDSNFVSFRKTYMDTVDGFPFGGGSPLARAILDIGQYHHSSSLPWWNLDTTWNPSPDSENNYPICYACQTSNLVVISDGLPKSTDGNALPVGTVTPDQVTSTAIYAGSTATGILPDASGTGGIPSTLCPLCNDFDQANDWKNNPTRVAWYLHNFDLRNNTEQTRDCGGNGGKQVMNTYAVGFGTQQLADANRLLLNMAAMGGGDFHSANGAADLRDALRAVIQAISTRSTSFSVATVSTLQTTAGHSVIIPRFDPAKSAHWRGHLFRYELFSEFVSGCVETADGSGFGDLDCDGKCQSVFLMDQDGAFISEDSDGVLRKNDDPTKPTCAQAPACPTARCTSTGNAVATSWWDAQSVMTNTSWSSRKVYTAIDRSPGGSTTPDGKIDLNDGPMIAFIPANAAQIAPYIPASIPGYPNVCDAVASRIGSAGDAATAAAVRAPDRTFCIGEIIRWMLGADVFNESGAVVGTTWPKASDDAGQNTLPDRPNKLGDIFHSSPVVVDPPLPPDGVLCPNGLSNQCLTSLWQTPVLSATTDRSAYDRYAKSDTYKNRRKLVVVGANDGMFHAFDGGTWHDPVNSADHGKDEWTWEHTNHQIDTSQPPFNGYFDRGSGRELWAVVPPDMLAKLPGYVLAQNMSDHQLLVDGSPMIRDVWVDGSQNAMSTNGDTSAGTLADVGSRNGTKEPWEFHTVAVVGERRGGTHYFALDLTDATRFGDETGFQPPKLLWVYPQPNSSETLTFGETYDDFLPVGPPIGPVRLEVSTSNFPNAPLMALPGGVTTAYEERWIAFLSGGFDPQYLRGRGVHMVDVWTGTEIWDFSYPDDSAVASLTDVRLNLRAPIPATVGMAMWGQNERRRMSFENDGYFDTATFGDAGGQLWVLRFGAPGHFENGRIDNWFGARIFEMQGCVNQPFFYITANVPLSNGLYRVLAGTGDRFNLLDRNGGTCGPDNIRACMQRGCSVNIAAATNYAQVAGLGKVSRAISGGSTCAVPSSSSTSTVSTCNASDEAQIAITCGSGASAAATNKDVSVTCTEDSAGVISCTAPTSSQGALLNPSGTISAKNWFFSLKVWDDAAAAGSPHIPRSIFWTASDAAAYDADRYIMGPYGTFTTGIATIDGALDNPTTGLAGASDPGWALWYDHDVSVAINGHTYPVNKLDERTSSPSAVYGGIYWNTTQPAAGAAARTTGNRCTDVNICAAESRRLTYHYGADVATGGAIMRDVSGNVIRAAKDVTLVPKMGDQPTVFVNQKGQVQVGLTSVNPERGATNISAGQMMDPAPMYGFTEVGRDLHDCRHSTTAPASGTCK